MSAARRALDRTRYRGPLLLVLAFVGISFVVVLLSRRIESRSNLLHQPWSELILLEGASHLTIAGLAVVMAAAMARRPTEFDWRTDLVALCAGFPVFYLLHVGATYGLRIGLFPWVVGRPYEVNLFSERGWLYEAPKDLLSYALLIVGFVLGRMALGRREGLAAQPDGGSKIALRIGSSIHLVRPDEIIFARAAGNYLEVHTSTRKHFARMAMTHLQSALSQVSARHARVHRSYLVNLDHVTAVSPTGEGDVQITLDNGATIPGSRRYRHNLVEAHVRTSVVRTGA